MRLWLAATWGGVTLTPQQRNLIEKMDQEHARVFGPDNAAKKVQTRSSNDTNWNKAEVLFK